jgi:hypothetical protein
MDAAACLASANMESVSTKVSEGAFYRNLEPGLVKQRYPGDKTFHRIRTDKWRIRDAEGQSGLSVNLAACVRTPECSIRIHSHAERFAHVVEIDLEALAEALEMTLLAIHEPLGLPNANPCHFNIVPTDKSIDDFIESLKEFLEYTFPPAKPKNAEERAEAQRAQTRYDSVLILKRDVVTFS